jgi:hypothetical protein
MRRNIAASQEFTRCGRLCDQHTGVWLADCRCYALILRETSQSRGTVIAASRDTSTLSSTRQNASISDAMSWRGFQLAARRAIAASCETQLLRSPARSRCGKEAVQTRSNDYSGASIPMKFFGASMAVGFGISLIAPFDHDGRPALTRTAE